MAKGAPQGNQNARKEATGRRLVVYLTADELSLLRYVQEKYEGDTSEAACMDLARKAAKLGINNLLNPEYYQSATRRVLKERKSIMQAVKHQGFAVYTREIDYGQGLQTVYAKDGKIVKQFIDAAEGMHHSYTGTGNPEWVGQDVSVLRGNGFKRLRNKDRVDEIELEWLQEY
jgi:hypothetical protein